MPRKGYAAENGTRAQPDVVIHLPGDRHLIIDSKVSLVHHEAYNMAESEAERSLAADSHCSSVRTHIRGWRRRTTRRSTVSILSIS